MQMDLRYVVMTNWDLSSLWTNTSATFISFFIDKEESYHLIGVGKTCPQLYKQNSWAMMDVYSGSGQVRATLSCPRVALTFALPRLRSTLFSETDWLLHLSVMKLDQYLLSFTIQWHQKKTLDLRFPLPTMLHCIDEVLEVQMTLGPNPLSYSKYSQEAVTKNTYSPLGYFIMPKVRPWAQDACTKRLLLLVSPSKPIFTGLFST